MESLNPLEAEQLFTSWAPSTVYLHVSGGEPLLNASFRNYLEQPENAPGVLSITTNGSLLDLDQLSRLKKFPRVVLHISVDSFDPALFRRLRAGGELSDTVAAIQRAVRCGREARSKGPDRWYVALNFLPTADNVEEIPSFLQRAAELGVDAVDVCKLDRDHPEHDFLHHQALLDHIDAPALARAIQRSIDDLPQLEIGGMEPVIRCLGSRKELA